MATTGPSPLNLQLPEVNDVVDLSVINANYGLINTYAGNTNTDLANKTSQISVLNTAVGAAGSVQNAVKATNVAGGAANRIPVQSAVDTTTFVAAPASPGLVLTSQLTGVPAFNALPAPVPYKVQTGTIASGSYSSGLASVTFTTAFDYPPIVILTCLGNSGTDAPIVTLNAAPSTTGFVARARTLSSGSSTISNAAPTTHWIAIQYSSSASAS